MWDGHLGSIEAVLHRLELNKTDARPILSASYRPTQEAGEFEKQDIDQMLFMDGIQPAQTQWSSPIVFALRQDVNPRFFVDNRKLDTGTTQDSYLIPNIDECIDSLGDATTFSTLEANSGYLQVKSAGED